MYNATRVDMFCTVRTHHSLAFKTAEQKERVRVKSSEQSAGNWKHDARYESSGSTAALRLLSENKPPTFDNLDRHARFPAAYREVLQAALRLRAPILGAVHVDISKGVGLGPQALGAHLRRRRVPHSSRRSRRCTAGYE